MNKEELLAYEERERDSIRSSAHLVVRSGYISDIGAMYPDLWLPAARGFQRPNAPLSLLCFLYPTTLVYIPPTSRELLEARLGIDIDSFVELSDRRIVQPLIGHPTYYADMPHLDPILKRNPPSVWARGTSVLDYMGQAEYFDEANRRLAIEPMTRLALARQKWTPQYPSSSEDLLTRQIKLEIATLYVDLCAFGYADVAREIAMESDLDLALRKLLVANEILVYPLLMGVGGTPNYGIEGPPMSLGPAQEAFVRRLELKVQGPRARKISASLKLILNGIQCDFPKFVDADIVVAFHKADLSKRVWAAFEELEAELKKQHALEAADFESLAEKTESARKLVEEACKTASDLSYALEKEAARGNIRWILLAASAGAGLAGGLLAGNIIAAASLAIGVLGVSKLSVYESVQEWAVEKFVSRKFHPLVGQLWWLQQWRKSKPVSNGLSKHTIIRTPVNGLNQAIPCYVKSS